MHIELMADVLEEVQEDAKVELMADVEEVQEEQMQRVQLEKLPSKYF